MATLQCRQHPKFVVEGTEAQDGRVTPPGLHSQWHSLDTFRTEQPSLRCPRQGLQSPRGAIQMPPGTLERSVGQAGLMGDGLLGTPHLGLTWLTGMLSRAAMSSTVSLPSDIMPTPLAMALAVIGWSPVTMITW